MGRGREKERGKKRKEEGRGGGKKERGRSGGGRGGWRDLSTHLGSTLYLNSVPQHFRNGNSD